MKTSLLAGIACLFLTAVHAQKITPTDSTTLADLGIAPFNMSVPQDSLTIQNITEDQFNSLLDKSDKHLKLVFVYTPYCSGTPGAMKYVKEMQAKYPDSLEIIMLSSESVKRVSEVSKSLNAGGVHMKTYIIDKQYKESKRDNRKKGFNFRNTVCTECQSDIIGVPYCLVYDRNNKIIFHGYRGYKNELPADIVTYFMEKKD